ncbi:MAG: hypothetical protein AAB528_06420 [Chloroflexota bacterium]
MPEIKDTSPIVVHAFFGALLSVVAAVVLNPFFKELWELGTLMGVIALAFVFLNIGFTPVGGIPLTVTVGVGSATRRIRVPFIVVVVALLILGLLLPWQIDAANKAIEEKARIEASTRYVFLILGVIYICSVTIYNLLVRLLSRLGGR